MEAVLERPIESPETTEEWAKRLSRLSSEEIIAELSYEEKMMILLVADPEMCQAQLRECKTRLKAG